MIYIDFSFICGFSIGFEFIPDIQDESHMIFDLGFFRILVSKELN